MRDVERFACAEARRRHAYANGNPNAQRLTFKVLRELINDVTRAAHRAELSRAGIHVALRPLLYRACRQLAVTLRRPLQCLSPHVRHATAGALQPAMATRDAQFIACNREGGQEDKLQDEALRLIMGTKPHVQLRFDFVKEILRIQAVGAARQLERRTRVM